MTARAVNIRRSTYDVYVGRRGKGQDGYFGNPYTLEEHGDAALDLFERYFTERLNRDLTFRKRIEELAGLRLGCFCAPGPCHASIIASWLNARPWLQLPPDEREAFEERAAIREFDGLMPRDEAERAAFSDMAMAEAIRLICVRRSR